LTVFELTLGQFEVANFTTWPAVLGLIVFVFMVVIVLCVLVPVTCVWVVLAACEE
jgi:Tfp pilus assembly protein PilO